MTKDNKYVCTCGATYLNAYDFCKKGTILGQASFHELEFLWVDCSSCTSTRLVEIANTNTSELFQNSETSTVLSSKDKDKISDVIVADILSKSKSIDTSKCISYNGMVAEYIGPCQFRLYVAPDVGTNVTESDTIKDLEHRFKVKGLRMDKNTICLLRDKYKAFHITLEGQNNLFKCDIDGRVAYLIPLKGLEFRGTCINELGPTVFPRVTYDELGWLIERCEIKFARELIRAAA